MNDTCSDIESVERFVKTSGWQRIGIDGVDSEGNAHVAGELSGEFAIPALDVNDYLHQNQGGYIDFIDYPALRLAVSSLSSFVLCGLCLGEVLENLGIKLDGTIYVKRMNDGIWTDEEGCVFPDGVEAAIQALTENRATITRYLDEPAEHADRSGDDSSLEFVHELMHYHDRWQPQDSADVVFERTATRDH